ncbi:MAG: Carbohydrate binding protein [Verrucomicrobia bacterium]|nr:Carbohydrate binding protein [Verrucomicrobiota bacterium]
MTSFRSQSGSVVLLAFCFVAVLGIALASYLAVSKQAMGLGNAAYTKDVSKNLAEMGLERALRSYSEDTFSAWTHSDATTATKTITIAGSRYGSSGISANVYIRVDHFRDTKRAVVWSFMPNYVLNDYVWYQGVWYICISAPPAHQTPVNTTYWKAAPEPWNPYANYEIGNIAIANGTAYRCTLAHINQALPAALASNSYWASTYMLSAWDGATSYAVDTVALSGGVPYRCIQANTNHQPPNSTYWLSAPVIYAQGVAALSDNTSTTLTTQYRALVAPAALFPNATGSQTYTNMSSNGAVDSYNSSFGTYASQSSPTPNPATNFSAVVAGGNTAGTAVSLGSVNLRGYVSAPSSSSSPYAPRFTYGSGASVGSAFPAAGIDLTRVSRSPYVPQFDVLAVTGGGNLPAGAGANTTLSEGSRTLGTAGATTPSIYNITQTLESGSPAQSGIYLNDPTDILTIAGPVILNVTGNLYLLSGQIIVASAGSLEIYFTGTLFLGSNSVTGGGIVNQAPNAANPDPKRVLIVGTSTINSSGQHYLWQARDFYGLIYMPDAYLDLWNSGAPYTNTARYGAFSASNIYFEHAATFHYDTTLRTAGKIGTFIEGPYITSEVRELTNPAERVVLP